MNEQVSEIIELCIENKLNKEDALKKLELVKLTKEEFKKYSSVIEKLFKKPYNPTISNHALPAIPTDWYDEILQMSINSIRKGNTLEDVCYMIYDKYRINEILMTYFVQAAAHVVRMSSLTDEEINNIGMSYLLAMRQISSKKQLPPEVEG